MLLKLNQMLLLISQCLWKETLVPRTGEGKKRGEKRRLQNRRKWKLMSYHTRLAITNRRATNKTRPHKHLSSLVCPLREPIFALWNQMKQISRGNVVFASRFWGFATKWVIETHTEERGERRRTHWWTTGFNWDTAVGTAAAARKVWNRVEHFDFSGFFFYFFFLSSISQHDICFKQNVDGMESQKRKYKSANSTHLESV